MATVSDFLAASRPFSSFSPFESLRDLVQLRTLYYLYEAYDSDMPPDSVSMMHFDLKGFLSCALIKVTSCSTVLSLYFGTFRISYSAQRIANCTAAFTGFAQVRAKFKSQNARLTKNI